MKYIKNVLCVLVTIMVLASATLFSIWRINPPRADESCPAFQRMMHNIEQFAADVRFPGTPNHVAVQGEIIAEIEAMGLTPIIHRTEFTISDLFESGLRLRPMQNYNATASWVQWTSENIEYAIEATAEYYYSLFPGHPWGHGGHIYVDNILVTLPAADGSNGGIMFVAHYDTMQYTPGAADAMTPVAAMLEALGAHAQNDNLANNLHFLFTDAEEVWALGAFAFSRDFSHLIDEVDMLVNLEAVGNSGGLLNFQTTDAPYAMISLYNRAVPRPIGFHWGDWVYTTQMPFSYTDFTVFREYGFTGLNFAILGGHEHYHTMTDNFENLNRNTAWHYFVTTMALAEYAANNSLSVLREPSQDAIFFTFLPGNMVVLTMTMVNILIGLAFAAAFAFLFYRFKTKMEKSLIITIFMMVLVLLNVLILIFFSTLSYLFWIPLLAVSISAFLKKWTMVYRSVLIVSGAVTLLLWVPPIYLLLLLFS